MQYVSKNAQFSLCKRYRYSLERSWNGGEGRVLFIGLNPSTADHKKDDPTIRRCVGFAKSWGFNGMERESQKKYFKPQLLKSKEICKKEQLVGEWTVMFKGYDMAKLYFEVLPDILPRQESHFEECEASYEINLEKP